jgi:hypothetical protein
MPAATVPTEYVFGQPIGSRVVKQASTHFDTPFHRLHLVKPTSHQLSFNSQEGEKTPALTPAFSETPTI